MTARGTATARCRRADRHPERRHPGVSGTLSLTDPGSRASGATADQFRPVPFRRRRRSTAPATAANVAHQLNFNWVDVVQQPQRRPVLDSAATSARCAPAWRRPSPARAPATIPARVGRTQANDGHFVDVTIVSLCGNGVTDGAFGEQCDQGGANGTAGSCCNEQLHPEGERHPVPRRRRRLRRAGDLQRRQRLLPGRRLPAADHRLPRRLRPARSATRPSSAPAAARTARPTWSSRTAPPAAPSAGACDVAETCDGVTKLCPADAFVAGGTECRASGGVCDIAEQCTGTGPNCPADAKSTAQCRASGGVCDLAESCDGVSNNCPADAKSTAAMPRRGRRLRRRRGLRRRRATPVRRDTKVAAGTECRASAGICDVAEAVRRRRATPARRTASCPAGTECRAVAGICDVAEACTGSSAACPADAFLPASTVCRAVERRRGLRHSPSSARARAPTVRPMPSSRPARSAAPRRVGEVCDIAEFCDGTNKTCPTDAVEPSSTVCRASSGRRGLRRRRELRRHQQDLPRGRGAAERHHLPRLGGCLRRHRSVRRFVEVLPGATPRARRCAAARPGLRRRRGLRRPQQRLPDATASSATAPTATTPTSATAPRPAPAASAAAAPAPAAWARAATRPATCASPATARSIRCRAGPPARTSC